MPLLDKLREQYGVGPVCSELHIAPSTYYHCQQQRHHPDKRSARAQRDDWLKREIQRVYDENHQVYGVRKVWRQLLREGIRVARCTVARLMAVMGLAGVKSGASCYAKVSGWPDVQWRASWRLWDLPVFSGVKRSVLPSAGKPFPQATA
ncbi:putative transposase [Escherichia coli DEC5E]|nr:putative transposase [Escherichia coli DEC5E]